MSKTEMAENVQKVINTLEGLDIKSTYDNMNRLLGSLQVLANVRDELTMPEVPDGNDHAE